MSAVYTNPRFIVKNDGFKFNNTFKNEKTIPEILIHFGIPPFPDPTFGNEIKTSGLCGGMACAALDFFKSKDLKVPKTEDLPPEGHVVADYIFMRQIQTFLYVGDEFIFNTWPPQREGYYLNCLPPTGINYVHFKKLIDNNKCYPLALFPKKGLIGHQVLGIGYTDDPDPEKVLIHIYDPNYKNREIVLKLNKQKKHWERRFYDNGVVGKMTSRTSIFKSWMAPDGYQYNKPDIFDKYQGFRNRSGRDLSRWNPPRKEDLTRYIFEETNFTGNKNLDSCHFEKVRAKKAVFKNTNASKSNFSKANLKFCNFSHSNLRGSTFSEAHLDNANFSKTDLSDAKICHVITENSPVFFNEAKLNETNLTGSNFVGFFTQAAIVHSNFNSVNLNKSLFIGCAINTSNLRGSKLSNTTWMNASLDRCNFSTEKENNITAIEHSDFSNTAITRCKFIGAKLYGSRFLNAAINQTEFSDCILKRVNFSNAAMNKVDFSKSDISYAKFDGAAFHGVDFRDVVYTRSSWAGASIRWPWKMNPSMLSYLIRKGVKFL